MMGNSQSIGDVNTYGIGRCNFESGGTERCDSEGVVRKCVSSKDVAGLSTFTLVAQGSLLPRR